MPFSGMFRGVALVRTDNTEEVGVAVVRVTRISDLRTKIAVTYTRRTFHTIKLGGISVTLIGNIYLCLISIRFFYRKQR
jgi:hypothetical protein